MNRRVWVGLCALGTALCLGCLETEPPASPTDQSRLTSFEDEVAGPGGDDDQLPLARVDERRGCVPQTCLDLSATCGSAPDGCGGVLQCGSCIEGQECGRTDRSTCAPAEAPRTCRPRTCGAECGAHFDGCAGVIDCGPCT